MKLILVIFMLAFCFTANFAQTADFEADFQKNKAKYKLDIYSEGEDASSGYDYLVYKKGDEIGKVRVLWSSLSYTQSKSRTRNERIHDGLVQSGVEARPQHQRIDSAFGIEGSRPRTGDIRVRTYRHCSPTNRV